MIAAPFRSRQIKPPVRPSCHSDSQARRRRLVAANAHRGWGVLLILAPRTYLHGCRAPQPEAARRVVQTLGLRHIAEGAVLAAVPTRETLRLGAAVDTVHAITMLALAVRMPPYRRAACMSLVVSGLISLSEYLS